MRFNRLLQRTATPPAERERYISMTTRLLFIALLIGPPGISAAADMLAEVVGTFYEALIHPHPRYYGQPYYRMAEHTLSPLLARALRTQDEYEKACVAITPPNMKPYILDQSPFFFAPEGAKTLGKLTQSISGDTAKVSAQLTYDEIKWKDTVTLLRQGNHWVIVNVSWGDGGSLVDRLIDFANYRCVSN